jgi:HSP20 family protein
MAEQTSGPQKPGSEDGRRQGQSQEGGETQSRGLARSPRRGGAQGLTRSTYSPPLFSMGPLSLLSMNPFSLMRQFSDEMDEMFSSFGGGEGRLDRPGALARAAVFSPQLEVLERDDQMLVRADLPGINPDEVRLTLLDDSLVIEGERRSEQEEHRRGVFRSERSYGMFRRVIPVPVEAREENASARFENGVLEISIPLERQRSRGRRIEISGQSPGRQGGGTTQASAGAAAGTRTAGSAGAPTTSSAQGAQQGGTGTSPAGK